MPDREEYEAGSDPDLVPGEVAVRPDPATPGPQPRGPDLAESSFDLKSLCKRAAVSSRTVRYYIQQGLVPSPGRRGAGTRYGEEHLHRILLVKRLQKEHLPLAEIRRRLRQLSGKEVSALLKAAPEPAPESAAEYIRQVLDSSGTPSGKSSKSAKTLRARSRVRSQGGRTTSSTDTISQWERIPLSEDVEIHVRNPLTPADKSRLRKLLELSQEVFGDE